MGMSTKQIAHFFTRFLLLHCLLLRISIRDAFDTRAVEITRLAYLEPTMEAWRHDGVADRLVYIVLIQRHVDPC